MGIEPSGKVGEIFFLCSCPLHLAHGQQAGEGHVLEVLRGLDILSPNVGLHADDVALLLGGELRGQWIVGIDAVQREVTLDGHRCIHGLLLVEVEVAAVTGSHDDLVVQTGCLDASRFATPRHHRGMRRQSALQNLVPADDIASAAHHVLLHAVDEPTLQCQPLAFHQRLAVGTLLPRLLGALIAPDVDVVAGENLHHLVEYPFQKAESLLLGAIDLVEHVEVVAHHIALAQSARQLRVGGQRSRGMTGHLHLGDDGDEAVGSVGYDLAQLLLCVVAAMLLVIIAPRVVVIGVS